MTVDYWLLYLGTVLMFMSTPGPSHILMLSNSLQFSFKRSTATAAGDLSANLLQMLAASVGLVSLIQNSQEFFVILKWAGVAYLGFLGLRLILNPTTLAMGTKTTVKSTRFLFWQGFITSAANPKAVIFFAALFPQFIDPAAPLASQFFILSMTYLAVDGAFLCCYGVFAEYFAKKLNTKYGQYFNQISGSLYLGAAILLGSKDLNRT